MDLRKSSYYLLAASFGQSQANIKGYFYMESTVTESSTKKVSIPVQATSAYTEKHTNINTKGRQHYTISHYCTICSVPKLRSI